MTEVEVYRCITIAFLLVSIAASCAANIFYKIANTDLTNVHHVSKFQALSIISLLIAVISVTISLLASIMWIFRLCS